MFFWTFGCFAEHQNLNNIVAFGGLELLCLLFLLLPIESDDPLDGSDWILVWIINAINMFLFFFIYYDMNVDYNILIIHYFTWPFLTDLIAILLPPKQPHIYNIFHSMSAIVLFYGSMLCT